MPSQAGGTFKAALERADILKSVALRYPRSNSAQSGYQVSLHASLAVSVAAWDGYLNNIVSEFYDNIEGNNSSDYVTICNIHQKTIEILKSRFNTPNFENSRDFLVRCTGYDPYSIWSWPQRGMPVQGVKDFINEILKVRHAFAHGFSIPSYHWTTDRRGQRRLTLKSIEDAHKLFRHLVRHTDKGMSKFLRTNFGSTVSW